MQKSAEREILYGIDFFADISGLNLNKEKSSIITNKPQNFPDYPLPIKGYNEINYYLGVPLQREHLQTHIDKISLRARAAITTKLPAVEVADGINAYIYSRIYHLDQLGALTEDDIKLIQQGAKSYFLEYPNKH